MKPRISGIATALGVSVMAMASAVAGPIDVRLQPIFQSVGLGANVNVGVWVASNDGGNHSMAAADIMFGWDTSALQFTGINNAGAVTLLSSILPNLSPNEMVPPVDGDGFYQAYAMLGNPITVTPAGQLLTTLKFTAIAPTLSALVEILPSAGSPALNTVVYDGVIPNQDDTGDLGFTKIQITPEPATVGLMLAASFMVIRRRRTA